MEEIPKWEYRVETFGGALGGPKDEALTGCAERVGRRGLAGDHC